MEIAECWKRFALSDHQVWGMPRGSRLGRCCFLSTKMIRFSQPTKICLLQKQANEH